MMLHKNALRTPPHFTYLSAAPVNTIAASATHILLDLDGLLVNTEDLYTRAWSSLVRSNVTEDISDYCTGCGEIEAFANLRPFLKDSAPDREQIISRKNAIYESLTINPGIQPMEGAIDFVTALTRKQLPMCLVTNSRPCQADHSLRQAGLDVYLPDRICLADAIQPKPSPDLYFKALSRYKINAKDCIALEDSLSGVTAAVQAGVPTICVNKRSSIRKLSEDAGAMAIKSLAAARGLFIDEEVQ